MSNAEPAQQIEWIPLDLITVVNPRTRNQRIFKEIVENIAQIGLKRPITVTRRTAADGPHYDLVCGQGRLEAYRELGQAEVPALVVSANSEDCLIASLVENCARRRHSALDLLHDIGGMRRRGHSVADIARKTGLSDEYVYGVAHLLDHGEERLLRSAESGLLPLSVAIEIAGATDEDVQRALQSAYEKGDLRGRKLVAAKRLIDARRRWGKRFALRSAGTQPHISSGELVRVYEEEVGRKRDLIRRANAAKDMLTLIIEAVRRLSVDEAFLALLVAEGLESMPERIAARSTADQP
jgi:ParB family chromosome partitioning protein